MNDSNKSAPPSPACPPVSQELVESPLGMLVRLSQAIDIVLGGIGEWLARAETPEQIAGISNMLTMQADLVICQGQVLAAHTLMELLMRSEVGAETMRRAATGMLNVRPPAPPPLPGPVPSPITPAPRPHFPGPNPRPAGGPARGGPKVLARNR